MPPSGAAGDAPTERAAGRATMAPEAWSAAREIFEECKWMGSPVWSRDGIIAVGAYLSPRASLPDTDTLFNAGFGGNAWRAIDFFEGD